MVFVIQNVVLVALTHNIETLHPAPSARAVVGGPAAVAGPPHNRSLFRISEIFSGNSQKISNQQTSSGSIWTGELAVLVSLVGWDQ